MSRVVEGVAKALAGKRELPIQLDQDRANQAIADGWTPAEAIEQARWLAEGLFCMADGLMRGWNLEGHNQRAVELSLDVLARDLVVAMTNDEYRAEAEALLTRLNAPLMQLTIMVNETMSRVNWVDRSGEGSAS